MDGQALATRARGKLERELKRARLELRRRRSEGDLFIDYGWIRLLYSGDGDEQEVAYHLNQHSWREKDMVVFRSLLAPGQTAIDVGANLGFVTTMLASIVGPSGRVVSFEPSPAVFAKLEKTIAANGLSQVTAINVGCGAASSLERLSRVSASSGNASIVAAGPDSTEIRVEALDEVPEAWATTVSLLKIDTEGYEPEVLEGALALIEKHRPAIYMEMGGDYPASTRRSIELLTAAGYATDHVRSIDWSAVGNGSDYFFLPERRSPGAPGG
jgi:FkbM family methyltransferase